MSSRNVSVDIAKGIGIILVVLGHNSVLCASGSALNSIIFSFHMPLFFYISGLLLKSNYSFRYFFISRADALLKPYLFAIVLIAAISVLKSLVGRKEIDISADYFLGAAYGTGATLPWAQLWFLPHLFLCCIFSYAILKILKPRVIFVLIISIFLFSIGPNIMGQTFEFNLFSKYDNRTLGLPWSADLLPTSSAFFLVGYAVSRMRPEIEFRPLFLMVSIVGFSILNFYIEFPVDMNIRQYGHPLFSTLRALLGIYICMSLAAYFQNYPFAAQFISYIGSGSLFILIFHGIIQWWTIYKLSKNFGDNFYFGIVGFLFGIAFPLVFWELSKRNRFLSFLILPSRYKYSRLQA